MGKKLYVRVTNTNNVTNSVTNSVTGDTGTFVLGKTLSGGSDEVAKWLQERQSQSFDAVFVPAGRRVAIHVDRELAIDFESRGRRLEHAQPLFDASPRRYRSFRSWQRRARHVDLAVRADGVRLARLHADLGRGAWLPAPADSQRYFPDK